MYIADPVFNDGRMPHTFAGRSARRFYAGISGLQGTHAASKNFPEPNNCWTPGSTGKPDWGKIILSVEASLEIPAACAGSIIARTTLRDVVPGGASFWAESIRFGASDGANAGGLEKATRVVESDGKTSGFVEFVRVIPWDGTSCTAKNDLFVYVNFPSGGKVFTFIEIGYYPRVESDKGAPVDKSLNPAIRLNPCNNLTPIRSAYVPGKQAQLYRNLPSTERQKVNEESNRMFREETGVARRLDLSKPIDRLLSSQWLRIRDSVISARP